MPLNSIPNTGQTLDQTRDGIRNNFDVINTAFTVDHVSFNILPDQGKHKKVTFVVQPADPALSAAEIAMYSKLVSGNSALFLKDQNAGTVVNFTSALKAQSGVTTLPSGITIQWGYGATPSVGTVGVTTVAFPSAFSTCYIVVASTGRLSGNPVLPNETQSVANINEFDAMQFTIGTRRIGATGGSALAAHFCWVAIGVL